jgi:hypothetical protein
MPERRALGEAAERSLLAEFAADPAIVGALMLGSYARGEAHAYSDVDFERFVPELPDASADRYTLCVRDGRLVSITTTTVAAKRAELAQPELAIFSVPGLRQARVLRDPTGAIAALLNEARDFTWHQVAPAAAHYASEMVMGLAEEVHKLLHGVGAADEPALVNATLGLLLGVTRAVAVGRGMLIGSENVYYAVVEQGMRLDSTWTRCHRLVAGLDALPDRAGTPAAVTRALAALRLYEETATALRPMLRAEHLEVIEHTLAAIRRVRSAHDGL